MATKYGPRKKHNAGTIRKSTNNRGGSRTRSTTTTKRGNFTFSRSVNRNGTVRQTKTHKSPSGWITRSVTTIGSKPRKPKAPKFIKAKPFKLPKFKISKSKSTTYKAPTGKGWSLFGGGNRSRKSRSRQIDDVEYESYVSDESDNSSLAWWQWFLLLILWPFIWLFGLIWPIIAYALVWMFYFILAVIVVMIVLAIFT